MTTEAMTMFERDSSRSTMHGNAIVDTYEIREYQFICTLSATGINFFHVYIDGRSIGRLANTLDEALVYALAYKYDGANSQAAYYFARMIGMNKEPT